MANRKEGNARRNRRTAQQPAQRPGAPTLHQAEVAAPPLPPARRLLTIKDVIDRVLVLLERLWRRSPAPVQSPAAGAVDGVDETKIGAEQKPPRKYQAWRYQRDRPVRAAAVDPAAAMPHPPCLPPVMVNDDPYQNKDGYEEFCKARLGIAEDTEICTIYFLEETWRWPRGGKMPRSKMMIHFHDVHRIVGHRIVGHRIVGVKCDKVGCDVRFRSKEHRWLHVSYCTEIWKENPKLSHKRFYKGTWEDC